MKGISGMRMTAWIVLLLCMIFGFTGCGLDKTLKVGVESGFEPFAYMEQGQEKGFDIDLWEAAAEKAGIKYEYVPMGQGEMLSALERGDIDVALAGMTIKRDRKRNFDFTLPYYDTGLVILTRSDNNNIHNITDLKERTVATKTGSSAYDYLKRVKGIKEIHAFPEISEAYKALVNKDVDAAIFDEANAKHYMDYHYQGDVKIVGNRLTKEHYAFAFQKGNRLVGRINNAMRELSEEGAYDQLYMKWFNEKPDSKPGD